MEVQLHAFLTSAADGSKWRGVQLKHRDNFIFTLPYLFLYKSVTCAPYFNGIPLPLAEFRIEIGALEVNFSSLGRETEKTKKSG
jgi:hypothetical protein